MKLNISELKNLMSKISLAVEKSKLNPKSGWIELETTANSVNFKVSNYDYYLETSIGVDSPISEKDSLHVTILAETFIPLVSKLDVESVDVSEKLNSLILETDKSSYTFPVIKELGVTKCVDKIDFKPTSNSVITMKGSDLASVAYINAKGLTDAMFSQEIQQFIYVDSLGALTFTENMYVNDFKTPASDTFKLLFNATQAKLLEIFDSSDVVKIQFEQQDTYDNSATTTNKVCISADGIKLIVICQNQNITDRFPSDKLRALAANEEQTHVVLDKRLLDKALARLMVFDKKFDITIMDYSKLVFTKDYLELVSIKNKNYERIPYISSQNAVEHESMIRFADLINQLKAVTTKEIDISYGSRPAIVINSNVKQLIPEIKTRAN